MWSHLCFGGSDGICNLVCCSGFVAVCLLFLFLVWVSNMLFLGIFHQHGYISVVFFNWRGLFFLVVGSSVVAQGGSGCICTVEDISMN